MKTAADCRNCGGDGYSTEGGPCPACKGTGRESATLTGLAERQAAFRARRTAEGLQEVRGIFLPPELHAKLKDMARKMNKEKAK